MRRIEEDSPGTKIYVQSVLPSNDEIHTTRKNTDNMSINQRLRNMAREKGHTYIDLFSHFATPENQLDSRYSRDGLHLNGHGHQLWKNLIEAYVYE